MIESIENVRFMDPEGTIVQAAIDGHPCTGIRLQDDTDLAARVNAWIEAGNAPGPYVAPVVELAAHAAEKRWQKETGGILLPGDIMVATDPVAQAKIAAANAAFDSGALTGTIAFKARNGWRTMDAAALAAVYAAVLAHVQACYAVERQLADAIAAGAITSTAEIDSAFARL